MCAKNVSMQDIANKLGISKVSVSKALNNQIGISDSLKTRIVGTASELGYVNKHSNAIANNIKLAFIISKVFFIDNENFYTLIYYYLNKTCYLHNIELTLYVINSSDQEKIILPPNLNNHTFSALFVAGELSKEYLSAIEKVNLPTITIDYYNPNYSFDAIATNNFFIGSLATTYLINNGHRKIGFVGYNKYSSNITDRFFGFQKALLSNGIEYNENWNIINHDPATGYYTFDFKLPDDLPTAFVCHCDTAAYYLIQKLKASNIMVPDDISIISFDNTAISVTSNPKITTIDIDKKVFAREAYNQIMLRLQNPGMPPKLISINTSMIVRETVKNLNSVT